MESSTFTRGGGFAAEMTMEKAQQAMDICPVGSIIVREKGWEIPIGERKYDNAPIGSDIENK